MMDALSPNESCAPTFKEKKETDLRFAKRGLPCAWTRHSAEPHTKGESVHARS